MEVPTHLLVKLPVASRTKLERLLADRQSAFGAAEVAEHAMMSHAERAGRIVQKIASDGPGHALTEEEVARRQAVAADAQSTAARHRAAYSRAVEAFQAFGYIERVVEWLRRSSALGEEFRPADEAVASSKGDPFIALVKVRAEIATIDREIEEFVHAERCGEAALPLMLSALDDLAQRGQPRIDPRRNGDPADLHGLLRPSTFGGLEGSLAFFVWLLRDDIERRLRTVFPEGDAASHAEAETTLEAAQAERLKLERQEEALIVLMEERGQSVPRRPAADPRAVLEIV